jgi:hypothetical protein
MRICPQFAKHIPRALGVLFVYSGFYKLAYPSEAVTALQSVGVGSWSATSIITLVLMLELYIGVLLLANVAVRFSLILLSGLMLAFTTYLFYLSVMAHPPSCGCLGLSGIFSSNRQGAIFGLARNCVILWALKAAYDFRFGRGMLVGKSADETNT